MAIGAGLIAAWALVREPPRTRAGRWAIGLAIVFVASLPVLGLLTMALGLEPGWAEAAVRPAILVVSGFGAVGLGAAAREPERRGLLFIPLMLGASALLFVLGDLLFPQWRGAARPPITIPARSGRAQAHDGFHGKRGPSRCAVRARRGARRAPLRSRSSRSRRR